jgi:hypothetical protein
LLCGAALAAGCGGQSQSQSASVVSAQWRAETVATLILVREDQGPFPVFVPVERAPALMPLAEATIATAEARVPVPRRIASTLAGFWHPREGLYHDASSIPSLAASWLVVRALRAAGTPPAPDVVRALEHALMVRRTAAGYAWTAGGQTNAVATLYGVRLVDALGTAQPPFRACARRTTTPPLDALTAAATRAEIARHLGATCSVAPRPRVRTALARARGAAAAGISGIVDVEQIRLLVELEHAGALPRGATRPLRAALARALEAPAPPGLRDGTVLPALRTALDLVGSADVAVSEHAQRILERTLRFDGGLPEVVVAPDPLDTIFGLAAIELAGGAKAGLVAAGEAVEPLDRAVLRLGTGAGITAADARSIAAALPEDAGMRQLATAALVLHRAGPAACRGPLAKVVRGTLVALGQRPELVRRAQPLPLYWLSLLLDGSRRCLPRETGRLDRLAAARVGALSRAAAPANVLARWWAAESACLAGGSPTHWTKGLGTLARAAALPDGGARSPQTGRFSVVHTYALLRLDQLRRGCSPGWWERTSRAGPPRPE